MSKLNMYLTRQAPMPVRTFVQSTRIRSKARAFGSLGNCPSKPAPFGREFKALSQNGEDGLLYSADSKATRAQRAARRNP